jgi:hypothetical protein
MKRFLLVALALLVAGPAYAQRFGRYGDQVVEGIHRTTDSMTAAWTSATGVNTTLPAATPYLDVRGYSTVAIIFRVTNPGVDITQGTTLFECAHDNLIFASCHGSLDFYNTVSTGFNLNQDPLEMHVPVGGFSYFRLRLSVVIVGSGTANISMAATTASTSPGVIVMNNPIPVAGPVPDGQPAVTAPVMIAGKDDAGNVQTLRTDSSRNLLTGDARPTTSASAAWTSATGSNTTLVQATGALGYSNVTMTANVTGGSFSAGTINFEGSDDGGSTYVYALIAVVHSAAAPLQPLVGNNYAVAAGNALFLGSWPGLTHVRIRLNPALTGAATLTVKILPTSTPLASLNVSSAYLTDSAGNKIDSAISAPATAARGLVVRNAGSKCNNENITFVPIDIVTATTVLLATGVASQHVYVCSLVLFTAGANNVTLIAGTGATCGTSSAGVFGGVTAAEGFNFPAGGGIVLGGAGFEIGRTETVQDSLCIITSAATQLSGNIGFVIETP